MPQQVCFAFIQRRIRLLALLGSPPPMRLASWRWKITARSLWEQGKACPAGAQTTDKENSISSLRRRGRQRQGTHPGASPPTRQTRPGQSSEPATPLAPLGPKHLRISATLDAVFCITLAQDYGRGMARGAWQGRT